MDEETGIGWALRYCVEGRCVFGKASGGDEEDVLVIRVRSDKE